MSNKIAKRVINIKGVVQGVGFRPFVYNLAASLNIKGWVCNNSNGVFIEAEGSETNIEWFVQRLKNEAPPLSYIDKFIVLTEEPTGCFTSFSIKESSVSNDHQVFISPDVSICKDCLEDLNNPNNRRYQYPFINCTNCGPRFTIINNIPYDRAFTTMAEFPMCEDCLREYSDPSDRRFHAQPIACSKCGPTLSLLDNKGICIANGNEIEKTIELLNNGKIVAIKGLGGYHLACDARNIKAVRELRKRKSRDGKPFALMVKDLETVQKYCNVNNKELELLQGIKRPIVLLETKSNIDFSTNYILTDSDRLGIMLPYTPLHYLLFNDSLELLVMTSANKAGEPIFFRDEEAISGLSNIADYFLIHNREIFIRTDDSVTSVFRGNEYLIRRSRGYVPFPIDFSKILDASNKNNESKPPSVLACGGELKNTYCITKEANAFLSHHIGDLENLETLDSFEHGIEHFKRIFTVSPRVVAFDKHPEYLSSKYANALSDAVILPIQHHHAHMASCMAENGITDKVIGVIFDGTGYGDDGHIWGGEFFAGDYLELERIAHFDYIPLPGGSISIKEPWRMAVSYLLQYYDDESILEKLEFLKEIDPAKLNLLKKQIKRKINSPLTSSIGRLFDAVSALLGLCNSITYEGQAAIRLEKAASPTEHTSYTYEVTYINDKYTINVEQLIKQIVDDCIKGKSADKISGAYHQTMSNIILDICNIIRDNHNLSKVVLSGGVFQNRLLLELTVNILSKSGFIVHTHSKVPTNDGGIALGQAAIALCKYNNNVIS